MIAMFHLVAAYLIFFKSGIVGGEESVSDDGLRLNNYILHFEPTFFDTTPIADFLSSRQQDGKVFGRVRRSPSDSNEDNELRLKFFSHNRHFDMKLWPSSETVMSDDVIVDNTAVNVTSWRSRIFRGQLADNPESVISGLVTGDGLLDAHIKMANGDEYFIEPASRYFKSKPNDWASADIPFHSVVYNSKHIIHPVGRSDPLKKSFTNDSSSHAHLQTMPPVSCLASNLSDQPKKSLQSTRSRPKRDVSLRQILLSALMNSSSSISDNSIGNQPGAADENQIDSVTRLINAEIERAGLTGGSTTYSVVDWNDVPDDVRAKFENDDLENGLTGRSQPAKTTSELLYIIDDGGSRSQIELGPNSRIERGAIDKKKTTCMMYLQADHLFHRHMGSEEATIDVMTRHIQHANEIYRHVDFDGDGTADNITFMIKRIKVHSKDAPDTDPNYRYDGQYGVEKFLEKFSEENYDDFCLAYMFTYRDFGGGTLGLAWTGDLRNAGGICERNGHYRGTHKSLNTGIVTVLNYGKRVPPAVSFVTLAHELGHNFGSPHDPDNDGKCSPGGPDGNYIMFARATAGDKRNNHWFSPCSLSSIRSVLTSKGQSRMGCFTEPKAALCGNGVVEDGEECDCGWADECEDSCCWPQTGKYAEFTGNNPRQARLLDDRAIQKARIDGMPCMLRPSAKCSPTQGPCCTSQCEMDTSGKRCRADNGCRSASRCDGSSVHCPASEIKPDMTICHDEFVCSAGECSGSLCLAYGMQPCQCKAHRAKKGLGLDSARSDLTDACELCCKMPNTTECMSSFELNEAPYNIPGMFVKPGTPCNNYRGYCDLYHRCRDVDGSGPLTRLREWFQFSNWSLTGISSFLIDYWYIVVLLVFVIVAILLSIVRICRRQRSLVSASDVRRRRKPGRHHHPRHRRHASTGTGLAITETTAVEESTKSPKKIDGPGHRPSPRKMDLALRQKKDSQHQRLTRHPSHRIRMMKSSLQKRISSSLPIRNPREHHRNRKREEDTANRRRQTKTKTTTTTLWKLGRLKLSIDRSAQIVSKRDDRQIKGNPGQRIPRQGGQIALTERLDKRVDMMTRSRSYSADPIQPESLKIRVDSVQPISYANGLAPETRTASKPNLLWLDPMLHTSDGRSSSPRQATRLSPTPPRPKTSSSSKLYNPSETFSSLASSSSAESSPLTLSTSGSPTPASNDSDDSSVKVQNKLRVRLRRSISNPGLDLI